MPLFEYKCEDCGARFEELVSGEQSEVHCPNCASTNVSKQLSTFAARAAGPSSSASSCGSSSCGSGFS